MKTILISGASRGIGKAIAKRALKDGYKLSLGIRNPKDLQGSILDPKISGQERIQLYYYDANNSITAKEWVNDSIEKFGSIDGLINCAGIFRKAPFLFNPNDEEDIKELWQVNVMGPWILTKEAWEYLTRSGCGRVIFLSSMSGKRSKGNLAGYSISKFALMSLCQTIRNEGWDQGIRVTAICPSWVNTDMSSSISSINKDQMTQPKDIAGITSYLLNSPNTCIPFEIAVNCNCET